MSEQLNLEFLEAQKALPFSAPGNTRAERRAQTVRIVEYTPYPRRTRNERRRVGFTCNTSPTGMCLSVETPEKPSSLLRVIGTDVDGHASSDDLARVAWCEPRPDGRFWLGLELISATQIGKMLKVRHTSRRQKVAVHS